VAAGASCEAIVPVTAAEKLLARLDGVQGHDGRWRARCPAHGSRGLSLAVADIEGRILLHCFGGCSPEAVLESVGLRFADLYDRPLGEFSPLKKSPFNARDVLDLVVREALTISIIASDFVRGRKISTLDADRLFSATTRLHRVVDLVVRERR